VTIFRKVVWLSSAKWCDYLPQSGVIIFRKAPVSFVFVTANRFTCVLVTTQWCNVSCGNRFTVVKYPNQRVMHEAKIWKIQIIQKSFVILHRNIKTNKWRTS
jgi:hypothetical protein